MYGLHPDELTPDQQDYLTEFIALRLVEQREQEER